MSKRGYDLDFPMNLTTNIFADCCFSQTRRCLRQQAEDDFRSACVRKPLSYVLPYTISRVVLLLIVFIKLSARFKHEYAALTSGLSPLIIQWRGHELLR